MRTLALILLVSTLLLPSPCFAGEKSSAKVFVHDENGLGVPNVTVIALYKEFPGALEDGGTTDSAGFATFRVEGGRYVFSAEGMVNGEKFKTDLVLVKLAGDIEIDLLAADRSQAKAIWLSASPEEVRAKRSEKITVTISTRAALPVNLTFYGIEEAKSTATGGATFEIEATPMMEGAPVRIVAGRSRWQSAYWDIPVISALPPTPESPQINSSIEQWLMAKTYVGSLILSAIFLYPFYAFFNRKSKPKEALEEIG